MSAIIWNRICLILSSGGLFVTAYLTISKFFNLEVFCGGSEGCNTVLNSPYASIFGIPVSIIGLVGYAILAALAIARIVGPPDQRFFFTKLGLIFSSIGLAASAFFMFESFTVINATCKWCVTSAILMVLLFVSHLFLSQSEDSAPRRRGPELTTLIVSVIIVLAVIPVRLLAANKAAEESKKMFEQVAMPTTIAALIPPHPHQIGDNDAPVTIVEFGDLTCPHCRQSYIDFTRICKASGAKNVRFVFRHFPLYALQGHEYAVTAALISELAAEKGHFWDFVDEMYSLEDASVLTDKDIDDFAQKAGVDLKTLNKRITDKNDPCYTPVMTDMNEGRRIGVHATPTVFLAFKNNKPTGGTENQVEDFLTQPPYAQYVKGLE